MPDCELDHIVIGAASLDEGARFVTERLGVALAPGGNHPLMGTHNCLMRIGESCFLEVIAIDPDAPQPSRARWYALDDPAMHARLAGGPQLIAWVVRSSDIAATAQNALHSIGDIVPVTRDHLRWLFAVPNDGRLPRDGLLPYVIEWERGVRPWEQMADLGCRLERLKLSHPEPDRLSKALHSLSATGFAEIAITQSASHGLTADIRTADGKTVTL